MTALLTDNLPLLAGAPNGIKKLRELILELAVRGKLVQQDASDEPASELLKRIAAEKARLVAEGKIRAQSPLPKIPDGGQPYELPAGWEWKRFGEIFALEYGDNLPAPKRSNTGEYPVYGSNGVVGTHSEPFVRSPCVVIGRKGSAGALNLCLADGCCVTDVAYYCVPPTNLSLMYVFKLFHTLGLDSLGKGIKPGLNRNEAYALVVAIPPLAEQHRIVAKVDELMALCDCLEAQQADAASAHAQLVQALLGSLTQASDASEFAANWQRLAEYFHTLFSTEPSIDALKQTLLQLAVMGKLVPQDPSDEPAGKLMERLRQERSEWLLDKQDSAPECKTMLRKLSSLSESSPPFSLPASWQAAHLIDCTRMLVDCHNKTAPYVSEGIPIIRTSNIRNREFRFDDLKYVNEETYEYWSRRCPPEPGDIMFTREAPMGEAAVIPGGARFCLGQRTMLVRPMHDYIDNRYLLIALTEPHLLERASTSAIGSTVKHLRVGDVEQLNIPLPPLAEQHRIVAKVDQLMALCDQLKTQLSQARQLNQQLASTLVEQAVA